MGRKRPSLPTVRPTRANPYALTKLLGEQWGRLYARLYGLRFVELRWQGGGSVALNVGTGQN